MTEITAAVAADHLDCNIADIVADMRAIAPESTVVSVVAFGHHMGMLLVVGSHQLAE